MIKDKHSNVEKKLASLYIYLIIFRMIAPFTGLSIVLGVGASYFDVIINALGLFIALCHYKGKIKLGNSSQGKTYKFLIKTVVYLNFSSFVLACVTQIIKGNYAGESAFSGILGMEIYYFQYLFMVGYNMYISRLFHEKEVCRILDKINLFLICLGYYDILILLFGSTFKKILLSIDFLQILYYETNSFVPRILLTANEPSNAAEIVCIFLIPYLMAKIYTKRERMRSLIYLFLWIPLIIAIQSTSAYLMIFANILGFLILDSLEKGKKKLLALLFVSTLCMLFVSIVGVDGLLDAVFKLFPENMNVKYLVLEKIFSQSTNGSTTSRTVPFYINWGSFKESPLFGVGNGLQGYYYNKYFPDFAFHASENREIMGLYARYQTQLANGFLFFPSILSGYGLMGVGVIVLLCKKCKKTLLNNKNNLGIFYYYFLISIMAIAIAGFKSDFAGKYYLWFVLSIPFMSFKTAGKIKQENQI